MTIGLSEYQSEDPTRFSWSLLLPFRRRRAIQQAAKRIEPYSEAERADKAQ